MTPQLVSRRCRSHQPSNETELLVSCEFPLRRLSYGEFRNTYEIIGTNLVVKVPKPMKKDGGLEHARQEIATLERLRASRQPHVRQIKRYLPKVLWACPASGVIVMRRYGKPRLEHKKLIRDLETTVNQLLETYCEDSHCPDLHEHNFGVAEDGTLKIIDLGLMHGLC